MEIKHHPGTPCNLDLNVDCKSIPIIDDHWCLYFPKKLEIELTRNCNLKCIHCWNNSSNNNQKLPFSLIKRELDRTKGLNIKFTGGEPLLYTSLKGLLEICKKQNHLVELTSNGTQIIPEVAEYLGDYLSKINISLHGSNPEIHEEVTGIPGSYNKTIRGIKLMLKIGVNLTINYTIMRKNIHDVKNVMDLANELGVKGLRFNLLRHCGRGKRLEKILSKEIRELREEINTRQLNSGVKLERSELYTRPYSTGLERADVYGCSGMRNLLFVSSNANVYPCSLSNELMGNLNNNTLKEIWDSKEAANFRRIFICPREDCSLKETCAGKCKV